jgi:glycosyltransferase involved in cell wall biosynthesis
MMEALTVTGPAKNLIAFAQQARSPADPDLPEVELSVATFDRPSASPGVLAGALEKAGIRCHRIAEKHAGDPAVIPRLRKLIAAEQPDIVQTHNTKSHLLVRCAGVSRRIPWIAFHHGFTARDWKDRAYNRIGRWALQGAPRVITVCQAFERQLVSFGISPSRISICRNSVVQIEIPSAGELAALRNALGIPPDARVVLAVGRLSSEKGHADLLEAVAALREGNPAWILRVVVVGDGPERQSLGRKAAALGVAEHILFAGHREDVRPFYGLADLFVLPSHSEGSPNVLLEAMSAGLPIVATAAGGSVELVSDGQTALLIAARDPRAMSAAMGRLLQDRELASRLGAHAREASRQYTPEAYARSVIAVYRAVLRGGGS